MYRPPKFTLAGHENIKLLCKCLGFLLRTDDVIISVGDFNLPNINWFDFKVRNDHIPDVFLDFCVYCSAWSAPNGERMYSG